MYALLNRMLIFININLQPLTNILTKLNVPFLFATVLRLTTFNYDQVGGRKKNTELTIFFATVRAAKPTAQQVNETH